MLLTFPFCVVARGDFRSPAKLATGVGFGIPDLLARRQPGVRPESQQHWE